MQIINSICFIICCLLASYGGLILILRLFKYTSLNNKIFFNTKSENYTYGLSILCTGFVIVVIDLLLPYDDTEFNCSSFIIIAMSCWVGVLGIGYGSYNLIQKIRSNLVER